MKITCLLLLLTFIFLCIKTQAQSQQITRNNIYFEAGGAAFFYSFNYERLLFKNTKSNLAVRAGVLYLPRINSQARQFFGIPIGVSYLKKLRNKYLEAGISFSRIRDNYVENPAFTSDDEIVIVKSIRFGIRKQPKTKGLFWNALLQG